MLQTTDPLSLAAVHEQAALTAEQLRPQGTINLSWLVRLRWAAMAGQLTAMIVVDRGMGIPLPRVPGDAQMYLANALDDLIAGQAVRRRFSKALGCALRMR